MVEVVSNIINCSTDIISNGGIFLGFFLVFIESFFPILPLCVFVSLNVNAFGFFLGILISWIGTVLGSFICYLICYKLQAFILKVFGKNRIFSKVKRGIDSFSKIKLVHLTLIITLPFTPSFLVNVLAGFSMIRVDKYVLSLIIGKMFSIMFWGYIGIQLISSVDNIYSIIYIIVTLVFAYIISKIVSKRFKID